MTTLNFVWTTSRGRDTYGYNICSLYVDGRKVSACNGGGYDMKGTSLGNWIARAYADRLLKLRAKDMPANSHWERAEHPRRLCEKLDCMIDINSDHLIETKDLAYLPADAETCPKCGGPTRIDYQDGRRVDDGRYFYGLTFHDPNYDPGKAIIGKDCSDRTLGGPSKGKTVEQAETAGKSFGLERYQAAYTASSKVPTKRHTVPLINGGYGFSTVERIMDAIGLRLEWINTRSKKTDTYTLHDKRERRAA
jgi:hypothetical protein